MCLDLNTMIIGDPLVKSQVISLEEHRRSKQWKEQRFEGIALLQDVLDIKDKVKGLKSFTLRALWALSKAPDGLVTKQLSEQLNLSRASTLKHAEKLVQRVLAKQDRIPHRNPEMPSTFKFSLSPTVNKDALAQFFEQYYPELEQFASEKGLSDHPGKKSKDITMQVVEIPSIFEPCFADIKAHARGGFWEAFIFIADKGIAFSSDFHRLKGWGTSVTHSRLAKLMEIKLIDRDKPEGRYVYFLTDKAIELCALAGITVRSTKNKSSGTGFLTAKTSEAPEKLPNLKPQAQSTSSSTEIMSTQILNDLAAAINLLADEVAKLNQRMDQLESSQESRTVDFSLEKIKHVVEGSKKRD